MEAQIAIDLRRLREGLPDARIIVVEPFWYTAEQPESITKPFSIITADELNANGASTVGEALRYQPGVSATGFGPNSSRPIVRGQDADRIKILRNSAATVDVSAVKLHQEKGQNSARYFTDWVLPQLDLVLPETSEPLEVWTTLDPRMQRAATAAIASNTPRGAQGARLLTMYGEWRSLFENDWCGVWAGPVRTSPSLRVQIRHGCQGNPPARRGWRLAWRHPCRARAPSPRRRWPDPECRPWLRPVLPPRFGHQDLPPHRR
ncbi:MAG: hypothetical protein B7Z50_00530 [Sphingomonadales bacterium 12-62-5]|nr:MAG: hypothetical protein B7Z50_00530 [Sphingomonadales bacterium 12-62-5]